MSGTARRENSRWPLLLTPCLPLRGPRLDRRLQAEQAEERKPSPGFKARPVPRQIAAGDDYARYKEEEAYRRIRVKIRAEKLLQAAKAPPSEEGTPTA